MNKTLLVLALSTTVLGISVRGQGSFRNLDFESAQIVFGPDGLATTNGLPAWTAFSGANQLFTIPYNAATFIPKVGLYGSNSLVINGNFSVSLFSDGSISQTGLVPADAESLLFNARGNDSFSLGLSLAGQSLSYIAISNGPNYTSYGAEISGFAGQTVSLTLLGFNEVFIDDIQFSPQAIPEASTLGLFALGGFFFSAQLFHRRFRRHV